MSRVGRLPVPIPKGVSVDVSESLVKVKGPKGELQEAYRPEVKVTVDGETVLVERTTESRKARGFHGLYRQLIHNMIVGVTDGYARTLLINGVGFRAEVSGNAITLNLGYSNPIEFRLPDGVTADAEGPNKLTVRGIDKQLVGKVASEIRKIRPPEPYKGKGVKYEDEYVRRKVGKSGIK
ncbi:MAG: 50S ribosomal protein L6 [Spirochaeta sp.]|jgi:large subunit ribosomal protein L6|nr:50S ribosomal protein L6 [Spirochaeta sp.]